MRHYINILFFIAAITASFSCTNEENFISKDEVKITFCPVIESDPETRSIGDGTGIDQLKIGVYLESNGLDFLYTNTLSWSTAKRDGVTLNLANGKTYKVLFWAEDKDNTAYNITDDGKVTVNYDGYLKGGFAKMEQLDAFYATASITPSGASVSRQIVLTRPLAQLNFADKDTQPEKGKHRTELTFHSYPVAFNPFTGSITMDESRDITFVFTDYPAEPLNVNGEYYFYASSNYFFASGTSVSATLDFQKADGSSIYEHEFRGSKSIFLDKNQITSILGTMVNPPSSWSIWDGTVPKTSTLTQDPNDSDVYIIDGADDIAWLGIEANAASIGTGKTLRFAANINMGGKAGQNSLKLPAGTTIDGDDYTLKGLRLPVGLFHNATELTVRDFTIDDAEIAYAGTSTVHSGILANGLYGSSSFTNVTVKNSSVVSPTGNAGGMIGYITKIDKSSREEKINVVFDNCHVWNTHVDGMGNEGYFVGMLRGYDNGEELIFKENCSAGHASGTPALESYIKEGNEAVMVAGTDFTRFNAWLGEEECYRGKVYFGQHRFIAKWDGEKTVTPLLADPLYDDSAEFKVKAGNRRYMIYSAFDLAGARKASSSPMALYFKEDVDMNGQGKDGKYYVPSEFSNSACASEDDNYFKRFSYVRHLDGQNHSIYNLSLYSKAISDTAYVSAFIYSVQADTTVHKNLNFRNCCSVAPVVSKTGYVQDLSYGAIFIQSAGRSQSGEPTYTMDNIHIYDSKVFALQHSGVLAGIVSRGKISNCSVNDCYIENYKCTKSSEQFKKNVEILGNKITISAEFYSYGEIGGLFGNVRRQSYITNCHVRGTTIHAYGEPDKEADMTSDGLVGMGAIAAAKGLGFYKVPGRHVSTMIGDIRTHNGETITITNCTVDAATKCTAEEYHHNSLVPYIGQAYYIQFGDTKGTVLVDGYSLTLADGNKNTNR